MRNNRFQGSILSIPIIFSLQGVMIPWSHAEITLDGTLGHTNLLTGPDFVIPADVGKQVGSNLFHSFGVFDVDTGESATFTGPNSVHHILGRVTGGSPSTIDGLLRSEIPGADLYMINPAGILFGPGARLEVQDSFHAGTADFIRLGENARFDATHPKNSVLAIAPPSAFGFLGESPQGISIEQSHLGVEAGKTLSLVGGDIEMVGGKLFTPSGRINIASIASKGEVISHASDLATESSMRLGKIDISQGANIEGSVGGGEGIFIRGGILTLTSDSVINTSTVSTDPASDISIIITDRVLLSGDGKNILTGIVSQALSGDSGNAGDVLIKAGTLEIRNGAEINANTFSAGKGGNLSVEADRVFLSGDGAMAFTGIANRAEKGSGGDAGDLSIKAGALEIRNGAQINANTFSAGKGGNLSVEADRIFLTREGTKNFTGIANQAAPGSSGNAGDLSIKAGTLEIRNRAEINANTLSAGRGGNLSIEADRVLLFGDGEKDVKDLTGIVSQAGSESSGDAGDLSIKAGALEIKNGAAISATTFGAGKSGNLSVEADRVFLSGDGGLEVFSRIANQAAPGSSGNAGDLSIKAGALEIRNGAQINANTFSAGRGGNLSVEANRVFLSGDGAEIFTAILSQAGSGSSGDAGRLSIKAGALEINNFAGISATTLGAGKGGDVSVKADHVLLSGDGGKNLTGIVSQAFEGSSGDAGKLSIQADSLKVMNGATVSARSMADDLNNPGKSGEIDVTASTIHVQNNSSITVDTKQANAGNINIIAASLVDIFDHSAITTSVAGGKGNGGDINIASQFVVLGSAGDIIAQAQKGSGGDISIGIINDGAFFRTPDSNVSASSQLGVNGSVTINAPESNIIGSISILPASFLDASSLLSGHCAARTAGEISTFVTVGRGGMPLSPDASLPAFYLPAEARNYQENSQIKKKEFLPDEFKKARQLVDTPLTINCDK